MRVLTRPRLSAIERTPPCNGSRCWYESRNAMTSFACRLSEDRTLSTIAFEGDSQRRFIQWRLLSTEKALHEIDLRSGIVPAFSAAVIHAIMSRHPLNRTTEFCR